MPTRPYLTAFTVEPDPHAASNGSGYRYSADFKLTLDGIAYQKIIGTLSWNANKTLLPRSTQTETTVTEAGFAVWKSGLGWAKLEDISGSEQAWIYIHNSIIRFRKKFLLEVPVAPFLSEIPILQELPVVNSWSCVIEGQLDVVSYQGGAQITIE